MAAPQGLFRFGGLRGLCSASLTLTLGTVPNVATMYVAPQNLSQVPSNETLYLTFDGGGIAFPDSLVTDINFEVRPDGFEVWALSIADCRWRWQYPVVSGEYNIRTDDQKIHPATIRSARELAKILMEAIRFPRADISKVPNDVFPETHWEYTRVDSALPDLLEPLGLRVRLMPGNVVSVVKLGEGASLPTQGRTSGGITVKPPERPDTLVFVAGRSQWQHDFKLQAVGRDLDGSWKPIDQLSYKPNVGWEYFDKGISHQIKDPQALKLAKETVFKWYSIDFPFKLPVSSDPKQDVEIVAGEGWRILPMGERQLLKGLFAEGGLGQREETLPPWLYGQYYSGGASGKNNTEKLAELTGNVKEFPHTLYTGSFDWKHDQGVVVFDEPVYRQQPVGGEYGGFLIKPAELWLRVSCPLRDPETRQFYHFEVKRKLPGRKLGTSPKYIIKDDISAKALYAWVNGAKQAIGNLQDVEKYAKHYLDSEQESLQIDSPEKAAYGGFRNIPPDGAIQQVTWQVSEGGFATTVAARNNEIPAYAPSFQEKRLNQQAKAMHAFKEAAELREKKRGLR